MSTVESTVESTQDSQANPQSRLIELQTGEAVAVFDPEDGARLVSLCFDGHELLKIEDSRPDFWFGGFLLVPWAGLLRDSLLEFDGAAHPMPANWGSDSLHGLLRMSEFDLHDGVFSADFPTVWPFGGTFHVAPRLTPFRLTIDFTVTAGDHRMPVAIGWHPWFSRTLENGSTVSLALPSDAIKMERDDEGLPTGSWIEPGEGPWDDCFQAANQVTLDWAGTGMLAIRSTGGYVGIYDGEESAIAVEPMNAPAESLPLILEAHQSVTLTVELNWIRP